MRLIDADALDMYECLRSYYGDAWGDAQKAIDDAPTIDAEPVVRCKDCKFNYANQIPSKNVCQLCVELPISDEFYCAYGERREDGKID